MNALAVKYFGTERLAVARITAPDDLEKMTGWMHAWWGEVEGYSRDEVQCFLRNSLHESGIPQTFGLYRNDELIGMFQIIYGDLFCRPDINPWLANAYVDEAYRGRGFGRFMLSTATAAAQATDTNKLFLYTTHTGLYETLGWEFVEELDTFLNPRIQRLYRLEVG